jgi:hypothetical protein
MKLAVSFVLLALSSCMSVPSAQAPASGVPSSSEPQSQMAIYLGGRSFDKDLWSPVEDQGVFQVEYSHQASPEDIGWEVGFAGSGDDSTFFGADVTGRTAEIYGGVRKTFGSETVRPYLGAGLSVIRAEFEVGGASDKDTSGAGYVHGGVEFLISPTFFLGLDLRALFGSQITIAGVDGDADYGQAALTFGWRF